MKIGIDVRCLAEGRRTGVEEYTLNILHHLFELDQKNDYVLFLNSFREAETSLAWIEKYPNVSLKKSRFPNKFLNLFFWYLGWPKIDQILGGVDIFFMPNIIFNSLSRKVKSITAIHDLSFERYPEFFSLKRRLWHVFVNPKKICQKTDRIIAVSESTKKDLVSLYKINSERIIVVPNGLSEKFRIINRNDEKLIKVKEKYQLPYKFILYFGTIEPRKNVFSVLQAFEKFREFAQKNKNEEFSKFKLVLAGADGWCNKKIYSSIEKSHWKNEIILINNVQEEDKEYLYNLASIFIYPSFFEGFGFPPLEAMASGVPVVVSNNSSVVEVVGKAGIFIDPGRPNEILLAIKNILANRDLREKISQRGIERATDFKWENSAKELLKLCYNLKNKKNKK